MNLRDELQSIYDQHGRLTPGLVVDEARDRKHPLHPLVFDRSKAEAAEAWYRHRAHHLITTATITYTDGDDQPKSMRAFLAVKTENPENGGFAYEPAEKVARDPRTREMALREMERDWQRLKARWSEFGEFSELVAGDLALA